MTFGQLFNLSLPWHAHLQDEASSTYFKWLLGDLKEFNSCEVFIIIATTLIQTFSLFLLLLPNLSHSAKILCLLMQIMLFSCLSLMVF